MTNLFILTQNNTGVNVYTNHSVTVGFPLRIVIEADRPLDENFQDIYLIDSKGIRHNIILYFLNNRFEGEVDTLPFSCGIASLFVRVKDDVGTFFRTTSLSVKIMSFDEACRVESEELSRKVELDELFKNIIEELVGRDIKLEEANKNIYLEDKPIANIIIEEIEIGSD